MNPNKNYSRWSKDELKKAEVTAGQFLRENSTQISETMTAKLEYLQALVNRLGAKKATLDQRLDYLARISDIALMLKDDADGFFELASQPVVARILQNAEPRR